MSAHHCLSLGIRTPPKDSLLVAWVASVELSHHMTILCMTSCCLHAQLLSRLGGCIKGQRGAELNEKASWEAPSGRSRRSTGFFGW